MLQCLAENLTLVPSTHVSGSQPSLERHIQTCKNIMVKVPHVVLTNSVRCHSYAVPTIAIYYLLQCEAKSHGIDL